MNYRFLLMLIFIKLVSPAALGAGNWHLAAAPATHTAVLTDMLVSAGRSWANFPEKRLQHKSASKQAEIAKLQQEQKRSELVSNIATSAFLVSVLIAGILWGKLRLKVTGNYRLAEQARELAEIRSAMEVQTRELKNQVEQLSSEVKSSHLRPKSIQVSSHDQRFLDKVMQIVEENLDNSEFGAEDFGKAVGLSRMQLHRKLTALTGLTTSDFIRSMRLKRAAELLEARSGNISEVAYQVGFNSLSYFSKCFKEQFGMQPNEYASSFSTI